MFAGRTKETKGKLYKSIVDRLNVNWMLIRNLFLLWLMSNQQIIRVFVAGFQPLIFKWILK